MKIIIKCNGKWKGNKKAEKLLENHAGYLRRILPETAKRLGFKLPRELTIRPMRVNRWRAAHLGLFSHTRPNKYFISLLMDKCIEAWDKGRYIVDHECVHLVAVLMHKNWDHNESFKRTQVACCSIRETLKKKRRIKNGIRNTKNDTRRKRHRILS